VSVTSPIKKALNIHHFRVVNRFAHLKEVKISDIERFLASYVSMPTARKIIHQLNDLEIINFEQSMTDKRVKNVRFLITNLDEFM
jgi:DNA-binding MarR family transcriptional regulator